MKISKSINKKTEEKTYYRYSVTIDPKLLRAVGWTEKTKLKWKISQNHDKICLEKE